MKVPHSKAMLVHTHNKKYGNKVIWHRKLSLGLLAGYKLIFQSYKIQKQYKKQGY